MRRLITKPNQLAKGSANEIIDNDESFDMPSGNILMHKKGFFGNGDYYVAPKTTNSLIYGTLRSGAYQSLIKPTINNNSRAKSKYQKSMIINDIDGKAYHDFAHKLANKDYEIKVLDLRGSKSNFKYNPFALIIKNVYTDHLDLAKNECTQLSHLIFNSKGQGQNSYFYDEASAVFNYVAMRTIIASKKHGNSLKESLKGITLSNFAKFMSHPDKKRYAKISKHLGLGGKTAGSVMATFLNEMRIYQDKLARLTTGNTINFKDFYGKKPVAVFLETLPNGVEANIIATMLISQITNYVTYRRFEDKKALFHPLQVILNQIGDLTPFRNLDKTLSIDLSARISFMLNFQNEEQIEYMFGRNEAMNIIANCPMIYYDLTNSDETMKQISNAIGSNTVTEINSQDGNQNMSTAKKPIMPVNKLKHLKKDEIIVLRTNNVTNVSGASSVPLPIFDSGMYALPLK